MNVKMYHLAPELGAKWGIWELHRKMVGELGILVHFFDHFGDNYYLCSICKPTYLSKSGL
jgi:hypothetical protein